MKTVKVLAKTFEVLQRNVKRKIWVDFLANFFWNDLGGTVGEG